MGKQVGQIKYPEVMAKIAVIIARLSNEEIVTRELATEYGVNDVTLREYIRKKVTRKKWSELRKRGYAVAGRRRSVSRLRKNSVKIEQTELKQIYNERYVFLKQTKTEVTSEEARKEIALILRVLEVMREIIMDENYLPETK